MADRVGVHPGSRWHSVGPFEQRFGSRLKTASFVMSQVRDQDVDVHRCGTVEVFSSVHKSVTVGECDLVRLRGVPEVTQAHVRSPTETHGSRRSNGASAEVGTVDDETLEGSFDHGVSPGMSLLSGLGRRRPRGQGSVVPQVHEPDACVLDGEPRLVLRVARPPTAPRWWRRPPRLRLPKCRQAEAAPRRKPVTAGRNPARPTGVG